MKKQLKRIRGMVGMGLIWAAGWSPIGAVIGLVGGGGAVALAISWAQIGFMGGVLSTAFLGITNVHRRFDEIEMSLRVFGAIGGTVGGLLTWFVLSTGGPITLGSLAMASFVFLLGAGSAAGSLALARRAHDRELLDAGADVADIGLTDEEKRELLLGK